MTVTDWILDLALIAVVLLQIRGRRLTLRWLLAPVLIVTWAAATYLRAIPASGNDLLLIGGCAARRQHPAGPTGPGPSWATR